MRLFFRRFGALMALILGGALFAGPGRAEVRPADRYTPADSIEGNYLAGIVAGAARDSVGAAAYFREVLRSDRRNPELLERGFIAFLASGAMPDAFRAAERLVQADAKNGLAQLALGVRSLKAKQYQTARNHLQRGGRGRAADITATLLSAWAQLGLKETGHAVETVDRLRGESSYNLFRDYHAGLIADVAGNVGEATKRLKTAYDAERTTLRYVDAWGRFLALRGQTEAAKQIYAEFDAILPDHPVIREARRKLEAGQPLKRFVSSPQEGAAEALFGLGSVGNRQGDEVAALIYLRLALYLDPQHEMAILTVGDILERLKQGEDAVAVYATMPKDAALKSTAEIQIGLALEADGKGEEATKHLAALVASRPDDVDALTALGNVYRSRKQFAESAAAYEKALAKIGEPGRAHWNLLYFRGIAYERTKQWPKAEADFRKALALIPEALGSEKALVYNYLGYSWVDQGLNLDEAFQLLKKAVELRPRDGYIVDSLGWAYYKLGRYEEAVRELERAIELRPFDSVINDHLGDAYWHVGRKLDATFQWNHARDLTPEPEDLPRILKKIEAGALVEESTKTSEGGDAPKVPAEAEGEKSPAPKQDGG